MSVARITEILETLIRPENTGSVNAVSATSGGAGTIEIIPAIGYTNGVNDISVITDADFVAANIKDGVTIFGLLGTYTP